MLDIGKLIRGGLIGFQAVGFSSMLDIGKLIPFGGTIWQKRRFSSMLDIGKLIPWPCLINGSIVLAPCWI